ncbi:MAG: divalent-cation tolerance protein CutA [Bacillota bacterium]
MVLVYITFKDLDEARRIGKLLVLERLAACVNIFPGIESFFLWEGNLEQAEEVVMVAKTAEEKVEAVTKAVLGQHSYSVPAIIVVPVIGGNADFIEWVCDVGR